MWYATAYAITCRTIRCRGAKCIAPGQEILDVFIILTDSAIESLSLLFSSVTYAPFTKTFSKPTLTSTEVTNTTDVYKSFIGMAFHDSRILSWHRLRCVEKIDRIRSSENLDDRDF